MADPTTAATDKLLNVPGTVKICDVELTVAALSTREERTLFNELAAIVAKDNDPFQRAAPTLARLEAEKRTVERLTLLDAAAKAVLAGGLVTDAVVEQARQTNPRVLARELYRRGKKHHPQLTLEELEAVVTAQNVADVWFDLEAALGASGEGGAKN